MASRNEHTGDAIQTRDITDAYRDGYDRVFGNKKKPEEPKEEQPEVKPESDDGSDRT